MESFVDRKILSPSFRDLRLLQEVEPDPALRWFTRRSIFQLMAGAVCASNVGVGQSASRDWSRWLVPQDWEKQKDGPVISLGEPGAFDDMHIFAPFVVYEKGLYSLLYPGSRGTVSDRV